MRLNQLKEDRYRKHFYLISILFLTLTVLSVFQNCAPVVENSSNMSSGNGLPFGYDTKVDAFGYMSCTGVPDTATYSRGYFTYRVSVNSANSGLKMSQDFISKTATANPLKRSQLLAEQGINGSAQLNLMVRQVNNYNSTAASNIGHSAFQEGTDYDNIMRPLGDPAIALPIAQAENSSPGSRVQFFSGLPTEGDRRFEGSVRFSSSMPGEMSVRQKVAGNHIVALGYIDGSEPNTPWALASDATDNEKIHGLGYEPNLSFSFARASATDGTPIPYPSSTNAPRILSSIGTINMASGNSVAENWTCPSNTAGASFMIVRSQDILAGAATPGKVTCNPNLADSNDPLTIAIRKVLPATHWKIDIGNRCVVAIDPSTAAPTAGVDVCYGNTNTPPAAQPAQTSFVINYTGTFGPATDPAACGYFLNGQAVTTGTGATLKHVLCPNYVSVCVRN